MSEKNIIYLARFNGKMNLKDINKILISSFRKAKLESVISKNDITAVKVHFGEAGNTTYIPATYIAPIVGEIKNLGAKPFVTDTNVLYKSKRDNAIDHIELAMKHGFSLESLGAPIIIADGVAGRNETEIEINAPINKKVNIASEFLTANSIVVITHATGHLATGLGANIKNLGMGMASRKGKLVQHSVSKPFVKEKLCTACAKCVESCPVSAINLNSTKARIEDDICIGCGECLAMCRFGAIAFRWDSTTEDLQKQIVEHALGVMKKKKEKMVFLTFLINMTKDCDCLAQEDKLVCEDIGVLLGTDPVAIDQAVLDLTGKQGDNLAKSSYPKINSSYQLEYGEKCGLGSRKYELVELTF